MVASSHTTYQRFKSPLRVVVGFLSVSRERQKAKVRTKEKLLRETKQLLRESEARERELQKQVDEQAQRLITQKEEIEELRETPVRLPHDPKLPYHSFGPKMISMCCNLASTVGFRAAVAALEIMWDFFEVDSKLPTFETIRIWLMRVGVARLLFNREKAKNGETVWFVDHSCKAGKEKVLAILGIRLDDLPPPGKPLKHEDLMTLMVATGESWKREDVARHYQDLIDEIGAPVAINSDEAVELQEPAAALKNGKKSVLVQTDPKHKLANIIKSVIGKDKRFEKFQSKLGLSRSHTQQTELSHFTPPKQKTKARFMNLQNTLYWAAMISWHLSHANSAARADIATERMNEKFGWFRAFRPDVAKWSRCLGVVGATLKFINEQGLSPGATRRLKAKLETLDLCDTSREVVKRTLAFINESEKRLKALKLKEARLPMSTEILESAFGRYKQLERQHSAGGFTSLLASFSTLLKPVTPEEVAMSFNKVSTKDMKKWVHDQLGTTLQSKKNQAYAEWRNNKVAQK